MSIRELLDQLFEQYLSETERARRALADDQSDAVEAAISSATLIVTALAESLDHEVAPALCANLHRLYDYVGSKLMAAYEERAPSHLGDGDRVVIVIRDAFRQLRDGPDRRQERAA